MADAKQRLVLELAGKSDGAKRALKDTGKDIDATAKKAQTAGQRLASVGTKIVGAFVAFGAAKFLKDGVTKALAAEVSITRLKTAVDNTGVSYAENEKAIKGMLRAQGDLAAVSGGTVRSALTALVQTTGDLSAAQDNLGLALDISRAKGLDAEKAAILVGRVYKGNTTVLKRYGIVLKEGATAQEALAELQKKFGGAAEAYGKTTQGSMDRAKNSIARLQTTIGMSLLPTIGRLADGLSVVLAKFDELPDGAKDATIGIAGTGTAALIAAPYLKMLWKGAAALGPVFTNLAWGVKNLSFLLEYFGVGASAAGAAGIAGIVGGALALTEVIKPGGAIDDWVKQDAKKYSKPLDEMAAGAYRAKLAVSEVGKQNVALHQTAEYALEAGAAAQTTDSAFRILHTDIANNRVPVSESALAYRELGFANQDAAVKTDQLSRAINGNMVALDSVAGRARAAKDADIAAQLAKLDLKDAQKNYNDAVKQYGRDSDEAKRAKLGLEQAELRAADAAADYTTALQEANDAQKAAVERAKAFAQYLDAIRRSADAAGDELDRMYGAGAGDAARAAGRYGGPRAIGSIERPRPGGTLVTVAEDKDEEAIIPINRKQRSLNLLAETMERMGVAGAAGSRVVQQVFEITGVELNPDVLVMAIQHALGSAQPNGAYLARPA